MIKSPLDWLVPLPDQMYPRIPTDAVPWLTANGYMADGEGTDLLSDQLLVLFEKTDSRTDEILALYADRLADDEEGVALLADLFRNEHVVPADMPDEVVMALLAVAADLRDFARWSREKARAHRRIIRRR